MSGASVACVPGVGGHRRLTVSSVQEVLVASVPGVHAGNDLNKWGHMRMRHLLAQYVRSVPSLARSMGVGHLY